MALDGEELLGPAEEAVRRAAARVVHLVRRADALEVGEPGEEAYREPLVDQPVVHEEVGDPEQRHADARPHEGRTHDAGHELAAADHERDGDRRVEPGEDVVALEPSQPRRVMGGVHVPERAVPHPSVEEPRPRLHEARGEDRRDGANEDVAHHGRPRA